MMSSSPKASVSGYQRLHHRYHHLQNDDDDDSPRSTTTMMMTMTSPRRRRALSRIEEDELERTSGGASMMSSSSNADRDCGCDRGNGAGGGNNHTWSASSSSKSLMMRLQVSRMRLDGVGAGEASGCPNGTLVGPSVDAMADEHDHRRELTEDPVAATSTSLGTAVNKQNVSTRSSSSSPVRKPNNNWSPSRSWLWRREKSHDACSVGASAIVGNAAAVSGDGGVASALSEEESRQDDEGSANDNNKNVASATLSVPVFVGTNRHGEEDEDVDDDDDDDFVGNAPEFSAASVENLERQNQELERQCEELEANIDLTNQDWELYKMKVSISISTHRDLISRTTSDFDRLKERCTELESQLAELHRQNRTVQQEILETEQQHKLEDQAEI